MIREAMITNGMSAAQARSLGVTVPSDVPDCAVARLKPDPSTVDCKVDERDPTLYRFTVMADIRWEWFTRTYVVDEKTAPR